METPKKVHWASKKKKVEKVASEGGDGILKGLQRMGCKVQLKSSVAIAVDCLFQLIFAQNQSSVNLPPEVNACHQLVAHNGLRILAEKIQHPSPLRKELLLLLEVVTLGSTDLSTASGFDETVSTVTHVLLQQGDSGEHYTLLLRIVTNLSNLKPVAFSEEAESIAHHFKNVLLYTEDAEKLTFVLCCAVNLCKYDLYAGACRFAKYLCAQEVLSTLCTKMYHFYNSDDINLIVLSGYCALFLGTVSLFSEKEFDLRIQVITALAKVTKDTEMGTKVAHQPMKLIVAILQEFILFQSTSGTLTKSSLVEMSDLIDRIVKQNKISIDSE
ncbi:hypothetical protein AGDE_12754 [Angomonas deanei]|uniref:Uncharacterized protein n=1 Tax=Angomonas deanei TaxID=59799 RepID=A0A7G2C5K0_9TRYP|nr:hypothetical protein AGDE_12754 [Angomonas deanei]CAD2214765.1 hypothetical protein, conserved [Angomonas deanei]|eukprot:EPY23836.1 hypothetical protein AGDE_12754 [Angomonas deanei]